MKNKPFYIKAGSIFALLLLAGVLIVSLQNCGNYQFSGEPADGATAQTSPENPGTPDNPDDPSEPQIVPFACKTVIQLDASQLMSIPARTSDGLCYAAKILDKNAGTYYSTMANPPRDADVISRNHDHVYNDSTLTHHPYSMGQALIRFQMGGPRRILLAGALSATKPILVDNFVLVGFFPDAETPANTDISSYHAYGTADSTINNTNQISLRNEGVNLKAFASGGTSTIAPLDITDAIPVQQIYKGDIRALDCGSVGRMSDLYILFQ